VNEATEIKNDCQKDLDEAIPALQAAEAALAVLEPKDINTIKGFASPPQGIRVICKGCAILCLEPSDVIKTKNDTTLKMEINWWETSKNIMNNPKFINNLINYPKESVPEKKINELAAHLKSQEGIDYMNLAAA
jgi:dynein heavy chain